MFKKGSLELSVNAIVIIIIAITMLGVGMFFIKSVFGGATNKLSEALGGIDEQTKNSFKDSCNDDVCIQDSVELKKGETKTIMMVLNNKYDCMMNKDGGSGGVAVGLDTTYGTNGCQSVGTNACSALKVDFIKVQPVGPGKKELLPVVLSAQSTVNAGLYRWALKVKGNCADSVESKIDKVVYFSIDLQSG
ncbi:MAG: hypothetical protein HGA85_08500 [Nanoarchaeota archaeon]|nr:hypothetical protein [Nanoarchaeota archaeon]